MSCENCKNAEAEVERLRAERDDDRRREYGYSQETVDALTTERDKLQAEVERLRADAERYRWLRNNAYEELLYPQRAGGEVPDLRTKWSIPTLMCSNCIGGVRSFDESIDAARGES